MRPEEIWELQCEASDAAGPGDEGWNERYVTALYVRGLELVFVEDALLMAPMPYPKGWQYHYPSWIKERKRNER